MYKKSYFLFLNKLFSLKKLHSAIQVKFEGKMICVLTTVDTETVFSKKTGVWWNWVK